MKIRSSALASDRVDLVGLARHREHHVQEVLGVAQVVARIDERLADRIFVAHRGDGRDLGDDPVGRDLAVKLVVGLEILVVEGRQGADDADHHRHRVRVAAEAAEQELDLLVQHGVVGHTVHELVELGLLRQLAVQDQVGDLEERAVLGQILDRVAAMQQDALVAVDEGDLRAAAGGRGEAGVVGEHPGLAVELADVDDVRAERALEHREIDVSAVADGEGRSLGRRLVGHAFPSWCDAALADSRCGPGKL